MTPAAQSQQSPYMTPRQVSEYTGISVGALAQRRTKGLPPNYLKPGPRTVLYLRDVVDEWLRSTVRGPRS